MTSLPESDVTELVNSMKIQLANHMTLTVMDLEKEEADEPISSTEIHSFSSMLDVYIHHRNRKEGVLPFYSTFKEDHIDAMLNYLEDLIRLSSGYRLYLKRDGDHEFLFSNYRSANRNLHKRVEEICPDLKFTVGSLLLPNAPLLEGFVINLLSELAIGTNDKEELVSLLLMTLNYYGSLIWKYRKLDQYGSQKTILFTNRDFDHPILETFEMKRIFSKFRSEFDEIQYTYFYDSDLRVSEKVLGQNIITIKMVPNH